MKAVRVLCIDDDEIGLEQLSRLFGRINGDYLVEFCNSPAKAMAIASSFLPEIVISDLRMPEMDGVELIRRLRESGHGPIFMLLTGDPDLDAALAALNRLSVFRFLLKPATAEVLEFALSAAATELNLLRLRIVSEVSLSDARVSNLGICYLNPALEVIFANDRALAISKSSGAISIRTGGKLTADSHDGTAALSAFLTGLKARPRTDGAKSVFRIESAGDERGLVLSAAYHAGAQNAEGYYSVVLCDPRMRGTTPEAIAVALNILPSEARIAHALTEGLSVDEAAIRNGVSINTVRSYLKKIYMKTGVSGQADLVRLALLTAA